MQMFLPDSLVQSMYHFTNELNMCQLTPTETIILSAIQLTNSCKYIISNLHFVISIFSIYIH